MRGGKGMRQQTSVTLNSSWMSSYTCYTHTIFLCILCLVTLLLYANQGDEGLERRVVVSSETAIKLQKMLNEFRKDLNGKLEELKRYYTKKSPPKVMPKKNILIQTMAR